MKQNLPKVSIILVNYNQPKVTYECLESIAKLTYPSLEIWVVDNNSKFENRIEPALYKDINYIQSESNLGFAGGNNLAIKRCTGDYILLLNNDTEVEADLIEKLLQTFDSYPDAGIVSPKILFYNTADTIQYAGTGAINPLTCRGNTNGYKEKDEAQYDFVCKTELSHGACMMIKRAVIDKIGILSEAFFLYYEEYDYCEIAKKTGFSIYYTGLTKIYHKESVSVGKSSPLKSFYMAKNRILFAKRNFNSWQMIISLAYYLLLALPKNILTETVKGRFNNSLASLKGAFYGFTK
jgi:GT2 family glycosyltransferase